MPLHTNLKNTAHLSRLAEKFNAYICPIMLGTAVCYAVADTLYHDLSVIYTILFAAASWLLFGLFDRLKKQKRLGGLIYFVIFLALAVLSARLVRTGIQQAHDIQAPLKWFFGDSEEENQPLFLNAVFIGGGFFLISILYYFTQIRYRSLGVMLCTLFPFVIYTKRDVIMPELMVTVIVVLYLAVIVHNRYIDPSQQKKEILLKIDRSYVIGIAVFVSVTGTVTMILPKQSYVSLLEQNSDILSYTQTFGGDESGTSDEISETSSQRYGGRNYTGAILFTFSTGGSQSVYYLRKQPFDTFNGDVWETNLNGVNRYFYTPAYPEYTIKDILDDMGKLDINDVPEMKLYRGFAEGNNFSPLYLPAPLGTIIETEDDWYYRKFVDGRIERLYHPERNLREAFRFYEENSRMIDYARTLGFNAVSYQEFLSQHDSEEAQRLYADYYSAFMRYSDQNGISPRVAELAQQITRNYDSDIEKAAALEQYFENNGYLYDESYIPEDTSVDYFIFEGKKGICTNYATAMTLMARSIGLTARYVEGFAAFEKNDDGQFVIRDRHAHAFVEVYIPAFGWMTFDPTVSGYMSIQEETRNDFDAVMQFLSYFLVMMIVAVCIILFLLRDRIAECVFRVVQLFRSPEKRTLKLYAHVIRLADFSSGSDHRSYTVKMLREYLVTSRGVCPEKLFVLFEKTAFGGYQPCRDEYREAYREYKKCYRYLRKIPKKKPVK